ncbi:MAG: glutamyl-tRNA reductase [Kofleriaceae bacterium]
MVGISWRTAPVAVREKLAFREEEVAPVVRTLVAQPGVREALLISTCNRVEVYGVGDAGEIAARATREFLVEQRQVMPRDVDSALYQHHGPAAVRHVFRVASSLDSLVVGEAQILGQLKQAYTVAGDAAATGPTLARCLERAFGVAKRVRRETSIARGAANVSSVAVELATRVFGDLAGKSVLIVGAGKMSTLAARHLRSAGTERIVVTNRSVSRAAELAEEIDGIAAPWAELAEQLAAADVVISSTGAREPVLTAPLFKKVTKARRWKPMMIIDIAVPRDADPAIGELDGVYLFDIDDLDKVVAKNLAERAKAAEHGARIVEHEAAQFEQWLRSQEVVPTIRALRERCSQVATEETQKLIDAMARRPFSAEERAEAMHRLSQLIVKKLLHTPTTVLRSSVGSALQTRMEAVSSLFNLQVSPAAADGGEPPGAEAGEAPPAARARPAALIGAELRPLPLEDGAAGLDPEPARARNERRTREA